MTLIDEVGDGVSMVTPAGGTKVIVRSKSTSATLKSSVYIFMTSYYSTDPTIILITDSR